VRSGPCPTYVTTSTSAELAAIWAAIDLALDEWGGEIETIGVKSDCRAALAMADGSGRARSNAAQQLQRRIHKLLRAHQVELRCDWVKAHQEPGSGKEAYLNNQCDQLARARRRRRRRRGSL